MKKISTPLFILIIYLVGLLAGQETYAQTANQWKPPFKYSAPITGPFGVQLTDIYSEYLMLSANQFVRAENADGYQIKVEIGLVGPNIRTKLFTFGYQEGEKFDISLEIYYQNNSLVFRRFRNSTSYYDYVLLDQLFNPLVRPEYIISLYFTGEFFWIEASDANSSTGAKYLSPMYFGINRPFQNLMEKFLKNDVNAKVIIGESANHSAIIVNLITYSFNYTALRQNIQAYFSDITPYGLR